MKRIVLSIILSLFIHFIILFSAGGHSRYYSPEKKSVTMILVKPQNRLITSEPLKSKAKRILTKKIASRPLKKKNKKKTQKSDKKPDKQEYTSKEKKPESVYLEKKAEKHLTASKGKESKLLNFTIAVPLYKENPRPKYPRAAKKRGYQGTVLLNVLVMKDGTVGKVKIFKTSGYSVLDKTALNCVKKWSFVPAVSGLKKIEMWVKIPIQFKLKGSI